MGLFKKRRHSADQRPSTGRPDYLILELLEPRVLLSADAIGGSLDAADADFTHYSLPQSPGELQAVLQLKLPHLLDQPADSAFTATQPTMVSSPALQSLDLENLSLLMTAPAQPVRVEIIIVDADVPDAPQLLAQLRQNPEVEYQVHYLDAQTSGIAQVTALLQNSPAADAVHLLSHGSAGEWQLGSDRIAADTLPTYENSLRQWQNHLTADADILVYGCDVAANTAGEALLAHLATLIGADVAASDDLTGGTAGGDWQLEYHTGTLETVLPFAGDPIWQHNLATITVTTHLDTALPIGVDSVAELLGLGNPISLRQAIHAANLDFALGDATVHTIEFDLQGNYQIALTAPLPQITAAVVIDGTSEADFSGTPLVTLSGAGPLLQLSGDNITVRGLDLRGSGSDGLRISGDDNTVVGNVILANAGNGIQITGSGNIIGGTTPEARNIVSGNTNNGVLISGAGATGNSLLGNYIGTDTSGNSALANGGYGVRLENLNTNATTNNVIGGLASGAGNIISANDQGGIYLGTAAHHVDILGNKIGTAANGAELGNSGNGITVKTGTMGPLTPSDVLIQGNQIAHNVGIGVSVENPQTYNVHIVQNLIYDNGGMGIDLGGNGVTANDPQDADIGANAQSNFPVLGSVSIVGGQVRITGTINNAQDSGPLQIHFYYSSVAHSSGHGDAEGYIGSVSVTANGSGNATFDSLFAVHVPDASYITATATGNLGTSEFATNLFLATGNPANASPTGEVTVSGSLVQGALLTAANTLVDANGRSGPLQYQWLRNGTAIGGATGSTYTLTQADVGSSVSVTVSYTDDDGFAETVTSAPAGPIANLNDAPVGTVTISGVATQGETLAAAAAVTDADGLPATLQYQWYRNGAAISGATAASYELTQQDVGCRMTAAVIYTDLQGTAETVLSGETSPVLNTNDPPTGALVINGAAVEGQSLTANLGFSDGDGLTGMFNVQWYRDGIAVTGATGLNYSLTQMDVGARISVGVAYVDAQGTAESINSAATAVVANINDAPTGNLNVLGDAREGALLTIYQDIADTDGLPGTLNYQWYRDGVAIAGATSDSYAPTQADVGGRISVGIQYTDNFGSAESRMSSATAPVTNANSLPAGSVAVSGVAQQGSTLAAVAALTDADGLPATLNYQWYRDGVAVAGANQQNYVLTQSDVGAAISVTASYVDLQGTAEAVGSAATAPVLNINDAPAGGVTISGIAAEGETLTANPAFSDADGVPLNLNYQWYRDGVAIIGATAQTYGVSQLDTGTSLSVAVAYTDNQGSAENLVSAATAAVVNRNDPPLGTVTIVGPPAENELLSAQLAFTDGDGLPAGFNYQWYRNGAAVAGATQQDYRLAEADVGATMTVTVTYVDLQGTAETLASAASTPVLNVNSAPAGTLTLTGLFVEDQVLTATHTFTDADGLPDTFTYQWLRDGIAISGASAGTYALTDADVGARISVSVFYVDDHGQAETLTSAAGAPVTAVNDAPLGNLAIAGARVEGSILTANSSVTDADGLPATAQWQWYRDGAPIASATAANYVLSAADIGAVVSVSLSYTDDQGFAESVSATAGSVAALNYQPQGEVLISGTGLPGEVLSLSNTISDANGINGLITFIWQRDGEPIAGATGAEYVVTDADRGSAISALAVYTDARGFEEMVLSNLVEVPAPPEVPAVQPVAEAPPADRNLLPPVAAETPAPLENTRGADNQEAAADEAPDEQPELAPQSRQDWVPGGSSSHPAVRVDGSTFDGAAATAAGGEFLNFSPGGVLQLRNDNMAAVLAQSAEKILTAGALQSVIPSLQESFALLNNSEYSRDLQQAVRDIQDTPANLTAAMIGGTAAVSTGLSVGYVIWTLRSGLLMTGLLSSLPAWRFIDPLPILSGASSGDTDDDDESLESLVADDRAATRAGGQ